MEIFNIGPLELIIFLILAFVLLGPKDMVITAYKVGQAIRKFVRSPVWREILRSAQEIRELPTKLMDETGLQEELDAIKNDTQATLKEVNSSIKEVTEAARVPEAEHIRLETGPNITSASSTVPAATGNTYPPPVTKPSPEIRTMPAVFSGPPVPGMEVLTSPEAEGPVVSGTPGSPEGNESVAVDTPLVGETLANEAPAAAVAVTEEQPPARKRAVRKKKIEDPSAADGAVSAEAAETIAPPRKRAARKKVEPAAVLEVSPASAVDFEAAAAVEQPAAENSRRRKPYWRR
jgi:Sec-independent protein translocase protein TatA